MIIHEKPEKEVSISNTFKKEQRSFLPLPEAELMKWAQPVKQRKL